MLFQRLFTWNRVCLLAPAPPPLVPQVTLLGVTGRKKFCCNSEAFSSVSFAPALDNANYVFAGECGREEGKVLLKSVTQPKDKTQWEVSQKVESETGSGQVRESCENRAFVSSSWLELLVVFLSRSKVTVWKKFIRCHSFKHHRFVVVAL